MKITLYQIIPEPENRYLIFSDLRSIRAASGGHVPAEIYEAVFSGDLDIAVSRNAKNKMDQELAELEAVYVRFNVSHPEGFRGRSTLAVFLHQIFCTKYHTVVFAHRILLFYFLL